METHAERLRAKYTSLIHELGESRVGPKRLVDHLSLGEGLSYWWMTLLVEQNPWKSPSIADAIRLLALEEIVVDLGTRALRLESADRKLNTLLEPFARDLGLSYEWKRVAAVTSPNGRGLLRALPQAILALPGFARSLARRWRFRGAARSGWFGGPSAVFFCSYFLHLDREAASGGKFHSHQWEMLPRILVDRDCKLNWLQHFVESRAVPDSEAAIELASSFNRERDSQGFHTFVDAYLNWPVVLRALGQWILLIQMSWRLRGTKNSFRPAGSRVSLWPSLRGDWYASMVGSAAISNLVWIGIFDEAMRELPRQELGLFLCENHEWEKALVHAWRKNGHGRLVGVVHATVRFWDLRYFVDKRTITSSGRHPMPRADLMVLNGKAAADAYRKADYPEGFIVECEALRYIHLNNVPACRPQVTRTCESTSVLILGDSEPASTAAMLRLLESAAGLVSTPVTYTIKPHPAVAVLASDYPSLHLQLATGHLQEILQRFDLAYSANTTSASVDAYLSGLPVLVMLDGSELNFSPLRKCIGVHFVSTAKELAKGLNATRPSGRAQPDREDFFHLDPGLPRWNELLSNLRAT